MSSNEILTLQFGHYSNFIGTHWWNIQESSFQYDPDNPSEINHDILYREGLTLKGDVTFTPRLLLVDLKGSLKALPEDGELYEAAQEDTDTSPFEIVAEQKQEKIDFQKDLDQGLQTKKIYDLDNDAHVWSDFLYTRFHPRSVNVVKDYQHSDEHTPFDIFPLGTNLWKKDQFSEDFVDKIRNYIEECNNFQGFHVLLDAMDGFSGLSTSCLEYIRDEYDTKSVFSFPVNVDLSSKNPLNLLSLALCVDGLNEHSSLFTPLSTKSRRFDLLSFKPDLPYHSSAILAATLDTVTLNYRLKNSRHSLIDLCTDMSPNGRKAVATSVRLPFPLKKGEDFIDCLDNWDGPLCQSVTPNCEISSDDSLQLVALRGIPESRLKRPPHVETKQRDMPAYRCDTLKEMLSYFLVCTSYGSRSEVTVSKEQMPVRTPFPRFFDGRVGKTGDVDLGGENSAVDSVNVLAGLHSGKFVGNMFDVLVKDLEKIKYKRFHQFVSEGVENDQFRECFDRILDLRDCYEDNYLV
ncbi:protein misato-like [Zophobas morio]|uniref:protein misato-like n=1 Tax=Zophobas morio TaxID=2755281 RepID=UPI0030831C15